MHLDVVDLRSFYYRTQLGRMVQGTLQAALRRLWPDARGMTIAGFGFAAPFLRPFLAEAERVLCLMPGQQGVMPWPTGAPNLSALVEETDWPIAAGTIDRLIVAHGLETCERADDLMEEIYRVLAPGGQVIVIVPNRAGMWARRDATPFGYGRPYSFRQVEALLREHKFIPERHAAALYVPPSHRRYWLRTDALWESIGRRLDAQMLAGALLVEASKQVYARPKDGTAVTVPSPIDVLEGLAAAGPKPANNRWPRRARPAARQRAASEIGAKTRRR
ncbi:MAG: methyltransferase domain-containing protein [Pseudomonadota bacterium]